MYASIHKITIPIIYNSVYFSENSDDIIVLNVYLRSKWPSSAGKTLVNFYARVNTYNTVVFSEYCFLVLFKERQKSFDNKNQNRGRSKKRLG